MYVCVFAEIVEHSSQYVRMSAKSDASAKPSGMMMMMMMMMVMMVMMMMMMVMMMVVMIFRRTLAKPDPVKTMMLPHRGCREVQPGTKPGRFRTKRVPTGLSGHPPAGPHCGDKRPRK